MSNRNVSSLQIERHTERILNREMRFTTQSKKSEPKPSSSTIGNNV